MVTVLVTLPALGAPPTVGPADEGGLPRLLAGPPTSPPGPHPAGAVVIQAHAAGVWADDDCTPQPQAQGAMTGRHPHQS